MKLEFNLPCKYYVAHYLKTCFGSPAYIRRESDIGKYFFSLLEDASTERDAEFSSYSSELKVMITEAVFLRKGCVLTKTGITRFNKFVEDDFKKQMNIMLDTLVEVNEMQIKKAIDFVYDRFDMDETIMPMETIIKSYYRYRNAKNKLIISK